MLPIYQLSNIFNSVINYIHSRSGAGAGASHFKSVGAEPELEPIIFKMSERSWSRSQSFLKLLERSWSRSYSFFCQLRSPVSVSSRRLKVSENGHVSYQWYNCNFSAFLQDGCYLSPFLLFVLFCIRQNEEFIFLHEF